AGCTATRPQPPHGGAETKNGRAKKRPAQWCAGRLGVAPGDDLLSHGLGHTTIGAAAFHFRVRDGNGWYHSAMVARNKGVDVARFGIGLTDV
ncbi:hypothetical protein BVRB_038210, partial [Beta vulgaris subsp. vulgaris]